MIEFRNGFAYRKPNVFHVFPSISIIHNRLNNCYFVNIDFLKRGYTFTIGKRLK